MYDKGRRAWAHVLLLLGRKEGGPQDVEEVLGKQVEGQDPDSKARDEL